MKKVSIVEVICNAWAQKHPELLCDILATDFKWHETPYSEAITSADELIKMWEDDLAPQTDIKVGYELQSDDGEQCMAHWFAEFVRDAKTETMDGIFQIKYDHDDKLTEFRQWWVVK